MVAPDQDDETERGLLATLIDKIVMGAAGPTVHVSFAIPALGNCPRPEGGLAPLLVRRS